MVERFRQRLLGFRRGLRQRPHFLRAGVHSSIHCGSLTIISSRRICAISSGLGSSIVLQPARYRAVRAWGSACFPGIARLDGKQVAQVGCPSPRRCRGCHSHAQSSGSVCRDSPARPSPRGYSGSRYSRRHAPDRGRGSRPMAHGEEHGGTVGRGIPAMGGRRLCGHGACPSGQGC